MKTLKQILLNSSFKSNLITYIALFVGISMLFISLQLYIVAHQILNNKQNKNDKYEYLVLNKNITNAMMGDNRNASFSKEEIEDLRKQKSIQDIGYITSNQFPIEASNFGDLAFSTQLFFESIPNEYLDVQIKNFHWEKNDNTIPVILSQDFLNLYNFGFALSQGLPQMSEETVKAISFNLHIANIENYRAEVVGFSQRYSSVIVPMEFMQYANEKYGAQKELNYSRLILKTNEPDNPQFVKYLQDKNYNTQQDKLKNSKLKTIVNIVFLSTSFIGIFIFVLCVLLLLMYLNLTITKSSCKLQLLSLLGYKTSVLQKQFTYKIIYRFSLVVFFALICTQFFNILIANYLNSFHFMLPKMISWQVVFVAIIIILLVMFIFQIKSKKILIQYIG